MFADSVSPRSKRVLLKGWEQFDEPVDRIVSIGAFEHFGFDRYDDFFTMAYRVLPDDGVMLLHTICGVSMEYARANDIPLTMELIRFAMFLIDRDLPGRPLARDRDGRRTRRGRAASRSTRIQSLQPHYARTLRIWADALESRRDEAIALQSEEVYDRYMHYLTGCARTFERRTSTSTSSRWSSRPGRIGVRSRVNDKVYGLRR